MYIMAKGNIRGTGTDLREGTEDLAAICSLLQEISRKNEMGQKKAPPVSRGELGVSVLSANSGQGSSGQLMGFRG